MFKGISKFIFVGIVLMVIFLSIWLQPLKRLKEMTRDNLNQLLHPSCVVKSRNEQEIFIRTREKLEVISKEEGINISLFSEPPDISFDKKEKLWIVDYNSTAKHFVRFTIDVCGFLETSMGQSSEVYKIEDGGYHEKNKNL